MTELLELEGVVVRFGRSTVLHGVDLIVPAGQVVALMGRNGVGKTTTVSAAAGLVSLSAGAVRFDGRDVTAAPAHRRGQAGMALVPQGRRLFTGLTVEENLVVARSRRPVGPAWSVAEAFDRFPQLAARRRVSATMLSGGEQQMLAIARAMMTGPRLVLMDEPSEGLAPVIVAQIRDIILELRERGGTILLVEQNLELGLATADHVYLMNKGEIAADGTPETVRADTSLMQRYLGVGVGVA